MTKTTGREIQPEEIPLSKEARMKTIMKKSQQPFAHNGHPPLTRAPFIVATRVGPREPAERTRWPKIGGHTIEALRPNPVFGDDEFLSRYVPGDDAFAYACGCEGTMALGRALHLPLFKAFGLTQQSDLLIRQRQISADAYGSCRRVGGAFVEDAGFGLYEMQTCELLFEPHPGSPVSTVSRGLRVRLPRTMSFQEFHKAVHRALAPATLNCFLLSPAGRRHLALLGREPASTLRYTKYRWGGLEGKGVEYRRADELLICRPRQDASLVAMVFEHIIIDHVSRLPRL